MVESNSKAQPALGGLDVKKTFIFLIFCLFVLSAFPSPSAASLGPDPGGGAVGGGGIGSGSVAGASGAGSAVGGAATSGAATSGATAAGAAPAAQIANPYNTFICLGGLLRGGKAGATSCIPAVAQFFAIKIPNNIPLQMAMRLAYLNQMVGSGAVGAINQAIVNAYGMLPSAPVF